MPPESNAKGDRRERELVNRLDELGFAVMRAPASGSATSRELPDVLAGLDGIFFAIEVKSSASDPIYLSGEEVEALIHFSQNFGAKPRIGVRFDQEEWYFFHPHDVFYTDGGNFRVKKELALEQGEVIADLLEAEPSEDNREETLEKVLRAVEGGHLTVEDAIEML